MKLIPVLFKPIVPSDESFTVGLDVEKIKHIYLYTNVYCYNPQNHCIYRQMKTTTDT